MSFLQDIFNVKITASWEELSRGNLVIYREIRRLSEIRVWGQS